MSHLHNPIQKVVKLRDKLQAKEVDHVDGIVCIVVKGVLLFFMG